MTERGKLNGHQQEDYLQILGDLTRPTLEPLGNLLGKLLEENKKLRSLLDLVADELLDAQEQRDEATSTGQEQEKNQT